MSSAKCCPFSSDFNVLCIDIAKALKVYLIEAYINAEDLT